MAAHEPEVDLAWIEGLIALGEKYGGIELELPRDEPARYLDLDWAYDDIADDSGAS